MLSAMAKVFSALSPLPPTPPIRPRTLSPLLVGRCCCSLTYTSPASAATLFWLILGSGPFFPDDCLYLFLWTVFGLTLLRHWPLLSTIHWVRMRRKKITTFWLVGRARRNPAGDTSPPSPPPHLSIQNALSQFLVLHLNRLFLPVPQFLLPALINHSVFLLFANEEYCSCSDLIRAEASASSGNVIASGWLIGWLISAQSFDF